MEYRVLGRSGLRVSLLSFGAWVTFGPQVDQAVATDCMSAAFDAGVNFFDNAEIYGRGAAEEMMGRAFRSLGWPRESFIVSTKLFMGLTDHPHMRNTLTRKALIHALDRSLERLQLDFVDVLFCHRPDPDTAIEETVRTMHDLITAGKCMYWGTSAWSADELRTAFELADRHHLHKPVTEQAEYNLLARHRVEREYAPLYDDLGLGMTTWSPLASGLLTGKYVGRIPEGSRATVAAYDWLRDDLLDEDRNARAAKLASAAEELGCTAAQLAIAWCAANPDVSSVITGASRVEQVRENLGALEVLPRLSEEMRASVGATVE